MNNVWMKEILCLEEAYQKRDYFAYPVCQCGLLKMIQEIAKQGKGFFGTFTKKYKGENFFY